MSNQHKNPTISFRITGAERKQIESRILASGIMKKDYNLDFQFGMYEPATDSIIACSYYPL